MTSDTSPPTTAQDEKPASDLKASDFFPPGEGWNQSATPEEIRDDAEARRQQR